MLYMGLVVSSFLKHFIVIMQNLTLQSQSFCVL